MMKVFLFPPLIVTSLWVWFLTSQAPTAQTLNKAQLPAQDFSHPVMMDSDKVKSVIYTQVSRLPHWNKMKVLNNSCLSPDQVLESINNRQKQVDTSHNTQHNAKRTDVRGSTAVRKSLQDSCSRGSPSLSSRLPKPRGKEVEERWNRWEECEKRSSG